MCLCNPQMEFSPFGQNEEVVEFCVDNGIVMMIDEPGVKNMRHRHPELLAVSDELEITVDEVLRNKYFVANHATSI
jgi:diketogulonate reductase-like aldo/keto reductase